MFSLHEYPPCFLNLSGRALSWKSVTSLIDSVLLAQSFFFILVYKLFQVYECTRIRPSPSHRSGIFFGWRSFLIWGWFPPTHPHFPWAQIIKWTTLLVFSKNSVQESIACGHGLLSVGQDFKQQS